MRAIKITTIILAIIVLAFVIVGLIMPKNVAVERSVVINAPAEQVYSFVNDLEKMNEWGPWLEADPNAKVTFEGTGVGQKSTWASEVEDVGSGSQEITELKDNELVLTKINFTEPRETEAVGSIRLEEVEGGTKVTWGIDMNVGFPGNVFMLFINMDSKVGPDFEKGLNNLKEMVEAAPSADDVVVETMNWNETVYIGIKEIISMDEISDYYAEHFPNLFVTLQAAGVQAAGVPTGLYFSWDEDAGITELMAAIPIMDANVEIEGYEIYTLPQTQAYVCTYSGNFDGTEDAHIVIGQKMEKEGKTNPLGVVIEEYLDDPEQVEASQVRTRIIYPID